MAATAPVTFTEAVPKRPVARAPKFGEWLELQRGDRSLEQIAMEMRRLLSGVGMKVSRSLIQKFEQGRVPSWPIIGAFSRTYKIPIGETVSRLVDALEFPGASDLIRHGGTGASGVLKEGILDDATAARLRELQDRVGELEVYEAIVRRIRPLLGEVIAAVGAEDHHPAARKAGGRRGHRKAG